MNQTNSEIIPTRKPFTPELLSALKNRLIKNKKKLKAWSQKNNYQAYRLYEKDIPEMAIIVDSYPDSAVVYDQFLSPVDKPNKQLLLETIASTLAIDPKQVFYKERRRQKGEAQYQKLAEESYTTVVEEGKLKFFCNLSDYLDTGLFLDHRPLRQWLAHENLKGKRVLNLFSYTASLSVASAMSGAEVTSIDLSRTYKSWALKNFSLNKLPLTKQRFMSDDIIAWLQTPGLSQYKYDLIICDPPTFSNSKKMQGIFDLSKDHFYLLKSLGSLLNEGGWIIFSGNAQKFALDEDVSHYFKVLDVSSWTIPLDYRNSRIHFCYFLLPKKEYFNQSRFDNLASYK